MGFLDAGYAGFEKSFDFKSRASRSEYWFFYLFIICVSIVIGIFEFIAFNQKPEDIGILSLLFSLATLIPFISVTARRLHDLNKSGWYQLIAVIPILGWALYLYWMCCKGTDGPNSYGNDPLDPTSPSSQGRTPSYQPRPVQKASFG